MKYGIYIIVPIGYPFPAAKVYHDDAFAPDDVVPVVFPQHLLHEQYADVLKFLTCGVFPSTFFAKVLDEVVAGFSVTFLSLLLLDVVTFLFTVTTLFIGSFIIFSDSTILSISTSFLNFALYIISFKPFSPLVTTLFVALSSTTFASFVIVSYGISTCSVIIFSITGV